MQLLSGKDAANHIAGIIHAKYQVHGFSVHLTVRKIYGIDPAGKLDFGGGEYAPAGRVELAPNPLRPEDNYRWWDLGRESYFVECNETLTLAPLRPWTPRSRGIVAERGSSTVACEGKCTNRARKVVSHR
jgi:hypothetical protein